MARFLVDEDLPRSLAPRLRAAGQEAQDVRDVGLRGRPDTDVFDYAVTRGLALISGDLGFGNLLDFPLGTHPGIIVVRVPNEVPTATLNELIVWTAQNLSVDDLDGNLVIVEPHRIRLRRLQ